MADRLVMCTRIMALVVIAALGTCAPRPAHAAVSAPTRLVVLKFDGLPPGAVDRYVHRVDARTGRSVLPWIERLFYASGVRFDNFYAHGGSLSEPSWTILDTGQHGVIKGNFEVDRNTGEVGYYLDFVSFYYDAFHGRRVYPQSVEALDAAGTPLLSDAFPFEERETGLQLNRRGTKFNDFLKVGLQPVTGPVKERLGDLLVGLEWKRAYAATTRDELLKALSDPSVRYVDYYAPYVDEAIHDDNSEESVLGALREADRTIGLAYAAVVESGSADRTVFAVVSDHGLTYDPGGQYSQGVNLISYLTKRELGANTVLSHDGPRAKYTLKGSIFKPWVQTSVITPSDEAFVAGRPERVTCEIDYDGNERAGIQLRSPDLNRLELLAGALRGGSLTAAAREAAGRAALAILERHRAEWAATASELRDDVAALRRLAGADDAELQRVDGALAKVPATGQTAPPSDPPIPPFGGASHINSSSRFTDLEQRRKELTAEAWRYRSYAEQYGELCDSLELRAGVRSIEALLAAPVDTLFGPLDLGDRPSAADLVKYPVGLREVALDTSGALDAERSFVTVNYLDALTGLRVRNSVRPELGTAPVAFCATALPTSDAVRSAVAAGALAPGDAASVTSAFLVYGSARDQLVLLVRSAPNDPPAILALPVTHFGASSGAVGFEAGAWRPGLPFRLVEDPALDTGAVDRRAWLASFHTEREWLAATHRTESGLGVVNLVEVLSTDYRDAFAAAEARDTSDDARRSRRFERRRRDATMPDLFVHASRSWNFDVKDFNAGGNHGGFGRQSMHAVLWLHGGEQTRVQPGPIVVDAPYDGLDFAPTIFEAAGVTTGGSLPPELLRGGFRPFPGRIAVEALREPR